ncbi:MAG TPA: class I SAM-dependent methyltransferase [Ilumatobacteraceae bacterium]|nr:class I SAM-dependent methyltransferase [Ilumatobacteraceae bacterium]
MPAESALGAAVRLTIAMEAAAALAARIRVDNEGLDIAPEVHSLLDAIATELADDADHIGAAGPPIVGMVRAFIRQSTELIENPGRIGDWGEVDEAVLQGVGRLSMAIVDAFKVAAESLTGLGDRLSQPGSTFLDVGTGTGWLTIATARAFPAAHVTGIDIFEPALQLARRNVATEAMTDRIELRVKDAVELDGGETYDAIWLPLPFMPKSIVPQAIAAAVTALRPGGWLLPGTFAGPGDRLSNLLVDLRTVRSGRHPWKASELIELIGAHGLLDAHEVPRTWSAPVRLYAGRRVST